MKDILKSNRPVLLKKNYTIVMECQIKMEGASLVAQTVESACSVRGLVLVLGLGRSPGGGHSNLLQYSCLENFTDRGYSPWGYKESDMTE